MLHKTREPRSPHSGLGSSGLRLVTLQSVLRAFGLLGRFGLRGLVFVGRAFTERGARVASSVAFERAATLAHHRDGSEEGK